MADSNGWSCSSCDAPQRPARGRRSAAGRRTQPSIGVIALAQPVDLARRADAINRCSQPQRHENTAPIAADISHILHGVELRLVLEPEAAARAVPRRTGADLDRLAPCVEAFNRGTVAGEPTHAHDYGFHEGIARATAYPRLLQGIRALEFDVAYAIKVWRHFGRMKPSMRLQDAVDEHRAILDCISQQDAEGARRAMRSRIEKARVRMMEQG